MVLLVIEVILDGEGVLKAIISNDTIGRWATHFGPTPPLISLSCNIVLKTNVCCMRNLTVFNGSLLQARKTMYEPCISRKNDMDWFMFQRRQLSTF